MLGTVIRNTAVFLGVVIVAVILLRDNTNFFAPISGARTTPTAESTATAEDERQISREDHFREGEEPEGEEQREARVAKEETRDPEPPDEASQDGPREQAVPDEMVIKAGPGGHFYVKADVDGNDVGFMVDTGASMVALSLANAESLGFSASDLNYTGRAHTANGIARFAPVMLSQISIGDITVHDVQAVVMEAPMNISLLGMTFLRRLQGFEIKDDHLIMRW